jgi:hypothetical protein
MWFHHDGATPYYSPELRKWLSENYPGPWIVRGLEVPIFWPAHSPELNPLERFFSMGIFEIAGLCNYNPH